LATTNKHIVNQNFPKTWITKKFINKQILKKKTSPSKSGLKKLNLDNSSHTCINTKGKYQSETRKSKNTNIEQGARNRRVTTSNKEKRAKEQQHHDVVERYLSGSKLC
jgi:hypothetical protein